MHMEKQNQLRKIAFFPPFIVLAAFVLLSIVSHEHFLGLINSFNNWIIKNAGWLASILALAIVAVSLWAAFSGFGKVRIGGEKAKPELSTFSWFTITLCTTMAAGILFWGPGEPIAHFYYPPTEIYGIEGGTPEALKFSMETMFLHWTIIPYAMYTLPAVVFAFMYYNAKKPFSIASEVSPLLGDRVYKPFWMQVIDAVTLFSISCGMAGSVAQAFMNIRRHRQADRTAVRQTPLACRRHRPGFDGHSLSGIRPPERCQTPVKCQCRRICDLFDLHADRFQRIVSVQSVD